MEHVVVKKNWLESLEDSLSKWFWMGFVGGSLMGGAILTGVGAIHGYVTTPQGDNVFPGMVNSVKNVHVFAWKTIFFVGEATYRTIEELRPSESSADVDQSSASALPESPKPPVEEVIPPPINDIVPDVGECDPYGPMDFSYDPPRLVCEVING